MMKSGLGKIFLKFLHQRSISLNNVPPFSKNSGDINTPYMTNSILVPGQNGIWVNIPF